MTENLKQQTEQEILASIRSQVQSEIVALNEQGKTPFEMANLMTEKLVQARYRMLQLDQMNRHLNSILNADFKEMIRSSKPNVISIKKS